MYVLVFELDLSLDLVAMRGGGINYYFTRRLKILELVWQEIINYL